MAIRDPALPHPALTAADLADDGGASLRSWKLIAGTLLVLGAATALLLAAGRQNYPQLHVVLDTGICLVSGVLTLVLWQFGGRLNNPLPRWIAVSFAVTFSLELVHTLVAIEWSGPLSVIAASAQRLRPSTWPPAAHLLPLGIAGALWLLSHGRRHLVGYALAMLGGAFALLLLFDRIPRYTPPTWLGITRPALVALPLLWLAVGWVSWRLRARHRMLSTVAVMAGILAAAHVAMLYSRAPHDTPAMIAHLGRMGGYLLLLLALTHMAASDMIELIRTERRLAELNTDLERRVGERTAELADANRRTHVKMERLSLLQEITYAIGEHQDLKSILQVVITTLESHFPVDFCCAALCDAPPNVLIVTAVGHRHDVLAGLLSPAGRARINLTADDFTSFSRGDVVYTGDIEAAAAPYKSLLARHGMRALIGAPLFAEDRLFGVLFAVRREAESFGGSDCDFMRQIGAHTALAAYQAQLRGSLQLAYDDLRDTQQAVMQQERLRALGQMASGIAHDINNAISPMALYAESLLEQELGLSESARQSLEIIQRGINDVAETVARLGEFYRAHEERSPLALVDLNRLVNQVSDLTRARWSDMPQQRGIVIRHQVDLTADLPPILGVESEIREALTNLVFNAVDAMPEGGTLTLRTSRSAMDVYVAVSDTGVGMDAETKRRCLEPFYTTKGDRGTGLGLAMVYGIAQRHGTELDIESALGVGTTMRIAFPIPVGVSEPGAPPPLGPTPRGLHLLTIDDDPVILASLRDVLEGDGHTVISATGGAAGIDAFQATLLSGARIDLVITDLGMPHVDGRRVAAAVKAASPNTPVILLTGWGRQLTAENTVPPQIDRVLSKPPRLRDLRAALSHCVTPPTTT